MTESLEAKALHFIELIQRASLDPERWPAFLRALAEELGDAAIALNLEIPGFASARRMYRVNSEIRYGPIFSEWVARGALPWSMAREAHGGFKHARHEISDEELAEHPFYLEYMRPQGFTARAPVGYVFGEAEGRPVAAIGIYEREGCRALGPDDHALLELLVPALDHAYRVHVLVGHESQQCEALSEAMDHFSSGVVLVDALGRAVTVSQSAQRLADLDDGFRLEGDRPCATVRASAASLHDMIEAAIHPSAAGRRRDEPVLLERPSGRRPLVALAAGLRTVSRVDYARDAVAALFVTDPEVEQDGISDHLSVLYGLTPAEAQLASLICTGHSVDSAARERGVAVGTARGQLKAIFAKTGTGRQPELVRLGLASYAGIRGLVDVPCDAETRKKDSK